MGRSVWVRYGDVEGQIEDGQIVTATRALSDWCLRGDDGSEPVAEGTALEILESRPWGAAMAEELPALSECDDGEMQDATGDPEMMAEIIKAAGELAELGLYEVVGS